MERDGNGPTEIFTCGARLGGPGCGGGGVYLVAKKASVGRMEKARP
jgi:hypothetical protein